MDQAELDAIEKRSLDASGESWDAARRDDGHPAVRVTYSDGKQVLLRPMRDTEPAGEADVEFIAAARRDIQRLVGALRSGEPVAAQELEAIRHRSAAASAGPWRAFLESDGGHGGSSVIRVSDSDDEPDLYLWLGEDFAPDADFEFVAAARQDVPRLLAASGRQI